MNDGAVPNDGASLPVGIFLSDNIRKYDSVRRQQGFLQRLSTNMLKKAFSGTSIAVRGSAIAADTLAQALLRESSAPLNLFVHTADRHSARMQLAASGLSDDRKQQTSIIAVEDVLARRISMPRLKAWFNPLPSTTTTSNFEGIELSQAVRQSSDAPVYPITLLTHGLSYHHLLYDFYLRILMEGTYECDSIICTSRASQFAVRKMIEHVEDEFQKSIGSPVRYKGRVDRIPLCVDTTLFATHDKMRARVLLKLPKDSLLILMLGRLSPLKADLYPFLSIIKSLIGRNPGCQLLWLIAGTEDEGYTQLLQQHARGLGLEKEIKFMLELSDETKALLMQSADIFTSPTDCVTESFGITVIEAMASGVPQVLPDWDGYRDTVSHGETGFLAPTRWASCCEDLEQTGSICGLIFDQFALGQSVAVDMHEMERYLHLLINDESLRQRMAEQSRKRAFELYSFKPVATQYDELWADLEKVAQLNTSKSEPAKCTRALYYHFFGHYASKVLSDDTSFEITPAGKEIFEAREIMPSQPAYLRGLEILNPDILRAALKCFLNISTSQDLQPAPETPENPSQLKVLVSTLGEQFTASPAHLKRHLLWLLKYGFITTKRET
jgi:glycosyltransferase involved in cell wall biosynthesis